jgi:hypothetical protein
MSDSVVRELDSEVYDPDMWEFNEEEAARRAEEELFRDEVENGRVAGHGVFSPGGAVSGNRSSATWRESGVRDRGEGGPRRGSARSVRSMSQFSEEDGGDDDDELSQHQQARRAPSVAPSVAPSAAARSDGTFAGRRPSELVPTMVGREGFEEKHYGKGIVSRPLIHPSESPLEWEEYNDALCTDKDGVFKPMRPARSMCVNVPSTFMSKGAVKASDFITPKDEAERRRVEGSAKLLGLFTAAASKGYANGKHAQLEPYTGDTKQYDKMKYDMEPFKNYVYTLVDETDPGAHGYRAQMFMYA